MYCWRWSQLIMTSSHCLTPLQHLLLISCHTVQPPTSSMLRITGRSFWYASPYLWNQLPKPHLAHVRSPLPIDSPLALSITTSSFIPGLKSTCFTYSFQFRLSSSLTTTFMKYTVFETKKTPNAWWQLCQFSTNFQKSFILRLSCKFAVKW